MEKKGFIQRGTRPADSRACLVTATKEGVSIINKAMPLVEKADNLFFERSSLTQEEIVQALLSLFVSS